MQTADPHPLSAAEEFRNAWAAIDSLSSEELTLRAALTAAVFVGVIVIIALLRRGQRVLTQRIVERHGDAAPKRPVGRATIALLSLIAIFFAIWLTLRIWGVDTDSFTQTATGGAIRSLSRAALIVTLAVGAVEFVAFGVDLFSARVIGRTGNRRRAAQLRTVAPLAQGIANTLIGLIALSMVLSEAGLEIAPLLAGAGIAGIAIGFGAQTLVKDLFTGAFLIIEDIVARGDTVEIHGFSGTVEAMTLRTIRLRDFDGTLHIFPYGEAQVIHNKTSLFSYFAFELQISYLSDIDRAIEVVERTGASLKDDADIAQCLLAPLEIAGVDRLADTGVVLKGRIKTEAGEQGRVGRAFYERVKRNLDEAGVLIAHRHLPVPPFETIRDQVVPRQLKGDRPEPRT